ncbi:MAG: ABC transporter ATP-binding protein [Planctomycetota bacterium]
MESSAATDAVATDAAEPAHAIEVQRLGKRLAGRQVLEQVSFCLEPGRILGLLGPNGAGKTTLLRCLTGCLTPDFGRCLICGHDPLREPDRARACFGYQPDLPPLEPELRVEEYLLLHARLRGIPRPERAARIAEALATVELSERWRHLVGTLSRGQKSRLALAETLLHRAPVLLLDEPASGLDPAQVVGLRGLLRRLAGEHSVLLATHHLAEASTVCDELVVLVEGRVRFCGTPAALAGDGGLEAAYIAMAGAGA